MRGTIFTLLTASIFSTALGFVAHADLAVKAIDPAEATARSDDSGAEVDSFFGDVGDFFKKAANGCRPCSSPPCLSS